MKNTWEPSDYKIPGEAPDMEKEAHQPDFAPYEERGENWAKLPTIKIEDIRKTNLAIYVEAEEELQKAYTKAVKKLRQLFKL